MADHVTNRMLRDKACGHALETYFPATLAAAASTHVWGRGNSSATLTAMRLATGRLLARMLTASSSEASSSMIAPRPKPQHLMNRHGCGAKHHGDFDGDLIKCGHVSSLYCASEGDGQQV